MVVTEMCSIHTVNDLDGCCRCCCQEHQRSDIVELIDYNEWVSTSIVFFSVAFALYFRHSTLTPVQLQTNHPPRPLIQCSLPPATLEPTDQLMAQSNKKTPQGLKSMALSHFPIVSQPPIQALIPAS